MRAFQLVVALVLVLFATAGQSQAGVIVQFSESGGDTTMSYSGSLDFTGLPFFTNGVGTDPGVSVFSTFAEGVRWNTGISVWGYSSPWNSSPTFTAGSNFINLGTPTFTQQFTLLDSVVYLDPADFVDAVWSGSGSTTFTGIALTSLVDVDTPVVWTLNSSTADTVTWQEAPTVSNVPEPTSLALLATGTFGFMGYGWRRKRKPAA